jgi:hypothetical protein
LEIVFQKLVGKTKINDNKRKKKKMIGCFLCGMGGQKKKTGYTTDNMDAGES